VGGIKVDSAKGIAELILFVVIFICIIVYLPLHDILWWFLEISIDFHLIVLALMGAGFIVAMLVTILKSVFGKGD